MEDGGPGGGESAPWAGSVGEGGDDAGGQSELAVGAVEGRVGGEVEGTDGGDGKPAEEDEEAAARFSEGVNGLEERTHCILGHCTAVGDSLFGRTWLNRPF